MQDFLKTADDLQNLLDAGFPEICRLVEPEGQ